jgi:hypothetical protein
MRRPSLNTWLVIAASLLLTVPFAAALLKMTVIGDVPFLRPEAGAQWIKITEPVSLKPWTGTFVVDYRKQFLLERNVPDATLTVRAFRTAQVYLDGQLVSPFNDSDNGKNPRFIELKGLERGPHELGIAVQNENGPALLLAYCPSLGISTGPGWESSVDGITWLPATLAEEHRQADLSLQFPSTVEALRSLLPVYIPLFIVCFSLALFARSAQEKYPWMRTVSGNPSLIRWMLLAAWGVLAVNNFRKIPLYIGFDASGHYAYILYIIKTGSIPLATEGWQMFQSPLYYLLSAGLMKLLSPLFSANTISYLLRSIPLLCGALQVQLAYQAVRYVFPTRADLQIMGTIVGGLLPMNLYISQVLGNEPLAGVLSSAAVVLALGILSEGRTITTKRIAALGLTAGLAALTKVSAVLLIPALALALMYGMSRKKEPTRNILASLLVFLGAAALISGWYYLRNWALLGKPFVGGWDVSRGIVWWQEPGYRIFGDFLSFGRSLSHPIFSALNGFWDSIYSTFWLDGLNSSVVAYASNPPWNYGFMLSGALLALVPSAGIVLGFIMSLRRAGTAHPGQVFAAFCVSLYFAALLYLYVTVPIYSTAKATYTLGLIPCYAILCATGLEYLTRTRYVRAGVYAFLACWALSAYSSYFVL